MSRNSGRSSHDERADVLDGAPLHHAPKNELGVVFLFAHLAKRWRLRIEEIKSGFPDCVAYQKTQNGEKRIRIEFEFKSKSYKTHGHPVKGCDWIVCWEHNWPDAPKGLNIVELRREFGLGFNVWSVSIGKDRKEKIGERENWKWSVPSQAHKGDLVIYYFTSPEMALTCIYRLRERAAKQRAKWNRSGSGVDYMAEITRVCELKSPIFLEDLKRHRILSTAGFVRQRQGRPCVTEFWPYLYDMIVRRNPSAKRSLAKYAPENLA